jgi:hypothetical protein
MIGKIAFEQGSLASPRRIARQDLVTIYRRHEKRPRVRTSLPNFLSWHFPDVAHTKPNVWLVPQGEVGRAMDSRRNKATPILVAEKGHT